MGGLRPPIGRRTPYARGHARYGRVHQPRCGSATPRPYLPPPISRPPRVSLPAARGFSEARDADVGDHADVFDAHRSSGRELLARLRSAVPAVSTARTPGMGTRVVPKGCRRSGTRARPVVANVWVEGSMVSYMSGATRVAKTADCLSRSASMMARICSGSSRGPIPRGDPCARCDRGRASRSHQPRGWTRSRRRRGRSSRRRRRDVALLLGREGTRTTRSGGARACRRRERHAARRADRANISGGASEHECDASVDLVGVAVAARAGSVPASALSRRSSSDARFGVVARDESWRNPSAQSPAALERARRTDVERVPARAPTEGKVLLTTTGEIEIELWAKCPKACRNFVNCTSRDTTRVASSIASSKTS